MPDAAPDRSVRILAREFLRVRTRVGTRRTVGITLNSIQSPWGYSPNYTLMMDRDFNRADEQAVLVGAAYDFSQLVAQGLSATFNAAAGWQAINPQTRASAPDQREYNLTVDARPPWLRPTFLQGWWLRVRGGILEQEGASLGWQVRVILNWERDLL